jgi:6,7-dimethyl-8-ribityllumazine synthase
VTGPSRVLVVEARFYEDLADMLWQGAAASLAEAGAEVHRRSVPGCFELPAAIAFALGYGQGPGPWDGYVALGCVIRGETDHYDHICREVSRGLMDLSVVHRVPLGFGVLTCHTYEQARVRADVGGQNKGADAAGACLRMIELKRLAAARG